MTDFGTKVRAVFKEICWHCLYLSVVSVEMLINNQVL